VDIADFLRGAFVGAAIAIPVGPVNLLTLRRTLAYGRPSGLATGIGAALADTFYGGIAAFGLTLISSFLLQQQFWLRLGGGIFLVVMGVRAFRAHPSLKLTGGPSRPGLLRAAVSSFLLTLSNPITLLAFGAVFGAVGVVDPDLGRLDATLLVSGVFAGSMSWWLLLTAAVSSVRARTSQRLIDRMSQVGGLLIAGFGLAVLATLVPS
jgi:threonine/homoserine/homoserine lactone efflux protein